MSWELKLQHALNRQSILTALVCLEEIVGFPVQKKIMLMANVASGTEDFLTQRRNIFDPTKKLNDIKIDMTYLEWYKKVWIE